MQRLVLVVLAWSIGAASLCAESAGVKTPIAANASPQAIYDQQVRPLLSTYCYKCHGPDKQKGDINLSLYRSGAVAINPRPLWKKCFAKLKEKDMPPEKEQQQPTDTERAAIMAWIISLRKLDPPDPGRVTIRRLNRAEYNNTIRDLIGVDWKPAADFPADDVGDGFDNIGDVLSISPLLMEKYLLAADSILDKIVVDDQLNERWNASEMPAIVDGKAQEAKPGDGRPAEKPAEREAKMRVLTTPGEIFTTFSAPKDGKFTIKVKAGADQAGKEPVRLAVKLDGQVINEIKVLATKSGPGVYACTVPLSPGQKRLSVIFLNPFTELPEEPAKPAPGAPKPPPQAPTPKPKEAAKPRVRTVYFDSVEVVGPPAAATTELHKHLFIATPGKDLKPREAAAKIAEHFATRAYRKPASKEQIELLLKVFDLADSQGEVFSEAVKLMLKAVLISPDFFFRIEDDRPGDANGVYAISDYELASRLSYFLWSSMPDDALFEQARNGKLRDPAVIEAEVRRLIKDPKSHAFVDNFAGQWLLLRNIFVVTPDEKKFPELTKELRQAMYDEGIMDVEAVMREDRPILEFIDTDFTFVNATLAKHYGISGVTGPQMRKVQLTDHTRGGVVTMGSLLTVTSNPTRTSPVKRGKWVLEEILGTPPPPPPPMVEALDKQDTAENASLSLRQKLEKHRANPACASCHKVMDAVGFGLENFDPIGRWRDMDGNLAVDSSGELPGNVRFKGPAELKKLFLDHKDDFARCLTEKLMTYALGRKLVDADDAVVDQILAAVTKDSYKFDTLLIEIAKSYPFTYRRNAR